ncbi:MAG TPA: PilC/PilY family type IV pilus protein [Candidatus Competibacteraceae bacterium]|nr:PilC/PilY family type IV pilus protein [Candidatus Competibacteraceae bacterium]
MRTKNLLATLAMAGALFGMGILNMPAVQADDTDIYFTQNRRDTDEPLVMFSIDWRPNLAASASCPVGSSCYESIGNYLDVPDPSNLTQFDIYRAVLKKVFEPLEGVKIGLMINHNQGTGKSCSGPQSGNNKCTTGGFIAFGFQSMQKNDANGAKAAFHAKLKKLPLPKGNESHSYQGGELFFEFFRYLTGQGVYNGHNGWSSFDFNETYNSDNGMSNTGSVPKFDFGWDTSIEQKINGKDTYISPLIKSSACAKIFTVNILFQVSNQDADSDSAITATKANGGMAGIGTIGQNNRFEKVLSWLRDTDLGDGTYGAAPSLEGKQSVISYFLTPKDNGQTVDGYARAGGTSASIELKSDPEELVKTLQGILNEILSVSTTFVSASVPVNVFNRSEILDNVYLALFQPAEKTVWPGNVKKLKINSDLVLVDANNQPAVANDGRIKYDALTYWTDVSKLPPLPDPNLDSSDEKQYAVAGRDGRFVPRGGAGHKIPGWRMPPGTTGAEPGTTNSGARKLYTQDGSSLYPLNVDDTTANELMADLGVTGATGTEKRNRAKCLIKYIRGYDVSNIDNCSTTPVRSWLMSDILHSRPQPINYGGNTSNPDIRLVFGSNDGFMRMLRNTDSAGGELGAETWAFMPRELLQNVDTWRKNANGGTHLYGVDGQPAVYMFDKDADGNIESGDGDKVWLFFGLRRGGKAYYALDITNPDSPSFKWKIIESMTDFGELGLTFSKPAVGELDWGSGRKPVLIFGGGYDKKKDVRNSDGTSKVYATGEYDDEGNALFVVDADTGKLVWKAVRSGSSSGSVYVNSALKDSIPSEVNAFDSDGDGLLDRAYVGDTGGVLWRADLAGSDRSKWSMKPVLSVGRHSIGGEDRRFFHRPDIALTKDDTGPFDAVVIGSGDRPNPLEVTIDNQLYMFKDRNITSGSPPSTVVDGSALADLTSNCLQDADLSCSPEPDLSKGWYITLEQPGEKMLSSPLTLSGAVFFTTYIPPNPNQTRAQCGPAEGGGRLYTVKLQNATAVSNYNTSTDGDGGGELQKEDRFRDLRSGGIPAEVVVLPIRNVDGSAAISEVGVLPPDLFTERFSAKLYWKTFWYQDER